MTVKDIIDTYREFHIGQRKNQADLKICVVERVTGKHLFHDYLSFANHYMSNDVKRKDVLSWFFDYKNRTIIISVGCRYGLLN